MGTHADEPARSQGAGHHPGRSSGGPAAATLHLGAEGNAVGRARGFVQDWLERGAMVHLADGALLVASELVTNALLHAGPPIEVAMRPSTSGARLEVRDGSSSLPVRPHASENAMTGRGLLLVEGFSRDWGVELLTEGKIVWAEIHADDGGATGLEVGEPATVVDAPGNGLLPSSDRDATAARIGRRDRSVTVVLGEVPTALLLSAKAHIDDVVREFTLAVSGARSGTTAAVPQRIAELIETVVDRFAAVRETLKRQALAAVRSGRDHISLELDVPLSTAEDAEEYLRALDEVDAYCRAARLLTLESTPKHRVFRHWYVSELVSQLRQAEAGVEPALGQTFEERVLDEIDAVAVAERRSERAARLHELVAELGSALTVEAVARVVLTEGVAALGASGGCVLLPVDEGRMAVPWTVGYDDELVARIENESYGANLPAVVALRTGSPVWLESRQERDAAFPELIDLEPGTVSLCALPLEAGSRCLGALRFSFSEARLFDEDERHFLTTMGTQTAQALDRARLYEQRLEAVKRLQRTLLPPDLPLIEGARVSAAYHPIEDAIEVGGDFYDLWSCGPGRWAFAIGDVSGTGPEAAALTAFIRYTLRALTLTPIGTVTVMKRLNRALVETAPATERERFCTLVLGFVSADGGRLRLELATGGHPPPFVLRADGSVETIELEGMLLGAFGALEIDRRSVALRPGDEIVLYTDGVTDARAGAVPFGLDGVVAAALGARERNVETAPAIEEAARRHAGDRLTDDVALLAIRVTSPED